MEPGFISPYECCNLCPKCQDQTRNHNVNAKEFYGMNKVISEEDILIPTPGVDYTNSHPSLTRYENSLTSTDRRINQGADQIIDTKKDRISETKDSQLKCHNLIPEFRETEEIKKIPKKPKAQLDMFVNDPTGDGPTIKGKSSAGASAETYRNIMQATNLVKYEKKPRSITYTDFKPKILYPFNKEFKNAEDHQGFQPETGDWIEHRKKISEFVDLEVPKRYGYYKFLDDSKPYQ